jgi:hypothetical protein
MGEQTEQPALTPNEQLAQLVVEKLHQNALITDEKRAEIKGKLASGSARQEDWKLWLDLPQMKKEAGK